MASQEHVLGAPEIAGVVRGAFGVGRHKAQWQATGDLQRATVQAVFLALLCIETALPLGGDITVQNDGDEFQIRGTGPRIGYDPALWGALKQGRAPDALCPALVQFALLALASAELGRPLAIGTSETHISITF
ncbi:histidine phosphotransferase family protein [Aquicoccus sp. G2-2]|uniref:histidine phosphotransferase family protein n=1 Tax=Aquicoccus sp. G2-2 TaxID=3092120 RepID=UPI002AE0381F|nr:histidine phosphotransferase family protein [Aquicoccus sp. G2-2]MEA1113186.1 histidine phosphotransferase family protein [Aquicoccus sp. G2-2]